MNTFLFLDLERKKGKDKKKKLFRVYKFSTFSFVTFLSHFFGRTHRERTHIEINANTHHLWNDDDENKDEYFTPSERKQTHD